jgi:hypothetical protein
MINIPGTLILTIISAAGVATGMFIFFKPESTIEIQRKFYENINWRIEPVSMKKEIRNTKIMGIFLAALSMAAIALYCLIKPF